MVCFSENISKYSSFRLLLFIVIVFSLSGTGIPSQERYLKYYIDFAVSTNPVIHENSMLMQTYRIRKGLVDASLYRPHIFGTLNYLFSPTFNGYGYDSAVTNGGLYSAMINLEYPLFTGSSADTKYEEITNDQKGYSNAIVQTKHEIEKNITDQYLKAYQDQEKIQLTGEILDILAKQKDVLRILANKSVGKISDISLLDIEYQTQVLNKNKLQITFESDLMDLNVSAGIHDTSLVTLSDPVLTLSDTSRTYSNFLESYKLDSLKLITEQKNIELNYKPQISFFVNGGLNAVTYIDMYKKFGFSTGLNITFNLYDGNQLSANNYLTKIRQDIISSQKSYFISQNEMRKRNIKSEIRNQDILLTGLDKQNENYKVLLELYRNQFYAGEISLIDYINVLKNYIGFRDEFIQNRNQYYSLINEFNYWNW
ncbi:MAG: TolC family protein [Ignavibacteria bacterium]